MGFLVGVDIGGTFTDGTLVDEQGAGFRWTKVPSIPHDPGQAFLNCFRQLLGDHPESTKDVAYLVHGSTVVINALLQGKIARTGLLTTEGFRDVLEIGRGWRGKQIYEMLTFERPRPIIPRQRRLTVRERIDHEGNVVLALDEEGARAAIRRLKTDGVEVIAIGLLHAYANPVHERRLRALVQEEFPSTYVCLSSEVVREFREYERFSTTVLNASVLPLVDRYVERLRQAAQAPTANSAPDLYLMASNGGVMPLGVAAAHPARMVNSGVAAGVMAGAYFGLQAGHRNLITMDMGGTSFDVGLIADGEPRTVPEAEVLGYALRLPMIDVSSIGAGGGSIAWLDHGGLLQVGPQSAGAEPGPACYDKGGEEATVTDAHLILGRLDATSFLGGAIQLDAQPAAETIRRLAGSLGMGVEETAAGIIDVVNANMARAIQAVTLERGYDPRDFALVAMGGAGPLHALDLAEELRIPTVIVPLTPGCGSALGLLASDIRHDHIATHRALLRDVDPRAMNELFRQLQQEALEWLPQRLQEREVVVLRAVDVRYRGQGFEVTVPLGRFPLDRRTLRQLTARFHALHRRLYGYASPQEEVEVITLRLNLTLPLKRPLLSAAANNDGGVESAVVAERPVAFRGTVIERCPVYRRDHLASGDMIDGPAVIQQVDSTTVIGPGWRATVDQWGSLIAQVEGARAR